MLQSKGYNYETISVDRATDNVCKPYQALKSAIYEERVELYKTYLLKEELIGLERNNNSGKIDHSPSSINSKDIADALCGALYNASQHAEQFAFEFGEDLDTTVSVSGGSSNIYNQQKQILVDFEEELKKLQDPIKPQTREQYLDFGMGASKPYMDSVYLANGIVLPY